MNSITELEKNARRLWRAPPKLTVSQWADANRRLSAESSSETGQWRTSRAEYQRGIMDAISDPSVKVVVFKSGTQLGKSEIINNILGFHIDQDPAPILMIQPTLDMSESYSKDRIAPMVRDTPALRGKIADSNRKGSGNTLLHKVFPGGHLTLAGANSEASLASRPIRILLCDEINKYPANTGQLGDPIAQAEARLATFWNAKAIFVSSPSIDGMSRITLAYSYSDERQYFVPCPHCGYHQILIWANIKWDKDDDGKALLNSVRYECANCTKAIYDRHKPKMLAAGEWRATKKAEYEGYVGFHLSGLYSPWVKWQSIVSQFIAAKGNTELQQTWTNNVLAEDYEEQAEIVEVDSILQRREHYDHDVPNGVIIITAGADVQLDRIELVIMGFGAGEETWYLDYITLYGPTDQPDVWSQLDSVLNRIYKTAHETQIPIAATFIDSGYNTNYVYQFCQPRAAQRIFAAKGVGGERTAMIGVRSRYTIPNTRKKGYFYPLGVHQGKAMIYTRLSNGVPGPGYVHVPMRPNFDQEFSEQLTSEKLVTKYRRGMPHKEFLPIRQRNEVLDCSVYALCALRLVPQYEQQLNVIPARTMRPPPRKNNPQPMPGEPWFQRNTGWFD